MNSFVRIFKSNNNNIIGAIHFAPLLGYADCPGEDKILQDALFDIDVLARGGVKAVIIENNYDVPHKERISDENKYLMIRIGKELRSKYQLIFGVSVLWNDYESAFIIAQAIGARFIRVPVFVDSVQTAYGRFMADASKVVGVRNRLNANKILILADIQVKHAQMIHPRSIVESAKEAIKYGADGLILTGSWTGDSPKLNDLIITRKAVGDFPILVGSGLDFKNAKKILKYANGAIVSTSIKEGKGSKKEMNIKNWVQRISFKRTERLMNIIHSDVGNML